MRISAWQRAGIGGVAAALLVSLAGCGGLPESSGHADGDDLPDARQPGGGWAVPGDAVHSVVALEDSVAIDVFSPVRDEYRSQ